MMNTQVLALALADLLRGYSYLRKEEMEEEVDNAINFVEEWSISSTPSITKISIRNLSSRLVEIIKMPHTLNQASFGLCAGVAFYVPIIHYFPFQFVKFATRLLEKGTGWIGDLKVAPNQDFFDLNFSEILFKLNRDDRRHHHPCDMILLGALQEYYNIIFDFDYSKGKLADLSAGALAAEAGPFFYIQIKSWFDKTNLFGKATYIKIDKTNAFKQIEQLQKENDTVIIDHYSDGDDVIVRNNKSGFHVCLLEKVQPVTWDENMGNINLLVYTWGGYKELSVISSSYSYAVEGYILVNKKNKQ